MITKEILINNGYKKYDVPIVKPFVTDFYQKCIKDNIGKKYYIDFFFYGSGYEVKLYQEKEQYCMYTKLYAINNMNLEEIEKELENIWVSLGGNYYEKYEV